LQLRGDGFFSGTRVYIGGQIVPSTFVDSTTMTANVSRASLSSGRLPIYVGNELSLSCNAFSSSLALDVLPVGSRATITMVEYYNAALDYYFLTGRTTDQALLDGIAAWRRTGAQIKLLARSAANAAPLERFFFANVARGGSRGSHFFSSLTGDRVVLASLNPTNADVERKPFLEGIEGYTIPKLSSGDCPALTQPVYRAFKGEPRFVDDGNHRFSTSLSQHRDMVDRLGWVDEGIVFCAVQ
jgi:hypothetical protein